MKKLAVLILSLALLCASAWAEVDLSKLSYEALLELQEEISAEIAAQAPEAAESVPHAPVGINPSPDKYTWYVHDYVGRNVASFGYTSMGGDRLERYGAGYLQFIFITENGVYLDIEDEETLKQYVVTGQSLEPNTELKLTFMTDSDGEEYDNLVQSQNINEIELAVRRVDGETVGEPVDVELVAINPSPDKYTFYIKNYVGKNLAAFGYTSWGGDRMDEYGNGHLRFVMVAEDGAYIDPQDKNQLRQYYVTAQDIAPNSGMKLTFLRDSDGEEYDNLVDTQTYENITLYVRRLSDEVIATMPVIEDTEEE